MTTIAPATLTLIILALMLTGALIARALPVAWRTGDLLERWFEYALIGALLNGWLAFTLAQIGIFSAPLHVAMVAVLCIIATLIRRSFGSQHSINVQPATPDVPPATFNVQHPTTSGDQPATGNQNSTFNVPRSTFNVPRSTFNAQPSTFNLPRPTFNLLLPAILLLFVFLVTPPFETIIGVRDAGVYANAGFIMARTGSLTFTDPLVAQIAADQQSPDPSLADAARQAETNVLGVQNAQRFIATRLRAAGFFIDQGDLAHGRVVPQGLHLFSAWIGLLAAFFGMHSGLLAPAVTGLLGVWSVALLGRRIAGPWVGLLAALFLALNAVQVWFSRYSTAETTAQFLVFAGLYAFARAFGSSTFNVQRSTCNVQRLAFTPQRSTFNVPLSPPDVQRATFNVQRAMPNVPPSTNVQPSTFNLQRATPNVPPSTNVQPSTFNPQPPTFNHSTFNPTSPYTFAGGTFPASTMARRASTRSNSAMPAIKKTSSSRIATR